MKKQKNNLPIIITQPSSSSFISSEDSTNKIFPLLSLDSGKIEPIIPFDVFFFISIIYNY